MATATPLTRDNIDTWIDRPAKPLVLALFDDLERTTAELAKSRAFADAECAARMEAQAEVARLRAERDEARARMPREPFDVRCADALADEVAALIKNRRLDSRSPAADALLDYRNPPSSPRADALAESRATVETQRRALFDVHDALHRVCNGNADLPAEIRALRAERDTLRADLTLTQAQLAEATAARAALDGQVLALREALQAELETYENSCLDLTQDPEDDPQVESYLRLKAALATTAQAASDAEARIRADERGKALEPIEALTLAVMAEHDEETTGSTSLDNLINAVLAATAELRKRTPPATPDAGSER